LSTYLAQRAGQQDAAQLQQGPLLAAQIGSQLIPAIPGIIDAINRAAG
jgi:hypothetical protein